MMDQFIGNYFFYKFLDRAKQTYWPIVIHIELITRFKDWYYSTIF
jgi:hypothetical protein